MRADPPVLVEGAGAGVPSQRCVPASVLDAVCLCLCVTAVWVSPSLGLFPAPTRTC